MNLSWQARHAIEAAKDFMDFAHPNREWWIVGGMLRDSYMGCEFKDIDIFVNGFETDLMPEDVDDFGNRNAYLRRAITIKDYAYDGKMYEINVIFMRGCFWNLQTITDRCDFGICQIGYCPATDSEYRSEQYESDREFRQVTLCRETTQERIDRMKEKFPSFDHTNPSNLSVGGVKSWSYNKESGRLEFK